MPTVQFVVTDTFEITGRGLVVVTETPMIELPIAVHVGHPVTFLTVDGKSFETRISGLEFFGALDPKRKFAFLVGPSVEKAMVPVGTHVVVEGQPPTYQCVHPGPK